jgi:transcriptional regulator with XRE-family HTH domain
VSRRGELARSRAFHGLTEEDCLVWFGVGMATLERIEAGEVEPGAELEARIARFLNVVGGGSAPPPTPGWASASTAPNPTGGAAGLPHGRAANLSGDPQ